MTLLIALLLLHQMEILDPLSFTAVLALWIAHLINH